MIEWTGVVPETVETYLALQGLASAPYDDFVYESAAQRDATTRLLWDRGVGDFSAPYGSLAMVEGRPAGVLVCLSGAQLKPRRLMAAMRLAKSPMAKEDKELLPRMQAARPALLTVESDDWYLSRIAVAPGFRGQGLGHQILSRYLELGREAGCRRCVLEVEVAADSARRLYERAGFVELGRGVGEYGDRRLEYVHLGLKLS